MRRPGANAKQSISYENSLLMDCFVAIRLLAKTIGGRISLLSNNFRANQLVYPSYGLRERLQTIFAFGYCGYRGEADHTDGGVGCTYW